MGEMAGKTKTPPPLPLGGGGQDEVGAARREGTTSDDPGCAIEVDGRTVRAGVDVMRSRLRRRDRTEPLATGPRRRPGRRRDGGGDRWVGEGGREEGEGNVR